ncbi:MAG: ATP-binding protein [Gemmatimonadota bacterium]
MAAWLAVLTLVGVVGGTVVVFLTARWLLTNQLGERLEATVDIRAQAVDRWVHNLQSDIVYAAQSRDLAERVSALREHPDSALLRQEMGVALRRIDADGTRFDEVFVELSPELRIVASTDPARDGLYRIEPTVPEDAPPGPYLREVYGSPEDGSPRITVAAPIPGPDGTPTAYLVGHIDFTLLSSILDAPVGFGGAAETYVVSGVGDRITAESVGDQDYPRGLTSEGIERALARETGVHAYANYRGERVLGAYTWLPERQMALLVELPEEAALLPARQLAAVSLAGGLIMTILLVVIGNSLARQIVAPVERLAAAAKRVASGDFSARVEPSGGEEIATLAQSFNFMVNRVEEAYVELQDQVEVTSEALARARRAGALVQSVMDNSPGLVAMVSADGRLSLVNRRFADVFPSETPLIGQRLDQVLPETVNQAFEEARRTALAHGEGVEADFSVQGSDGQPLHFSASVFPLSAEAPSRVAVGLIAVDRTTTIRSDEDRARLETQLRSTQKLESLGVLAGGVAHDFNNLLQALMGHASLLERMDLPDAAEDPLRQIRIAGSRAADLTGQLLAYAGRRALRVERVPLNELVVDLGELVRVSFPKTAELDLELSTDAGAVMADPAQISQVILNLLTNAGESLPDGRGRVTARTERIRLGEDRSADVPIAAVLPAGDYVRLTVEDNGQGMSAETLDRLFDPFFTTKESGRGLGLAAVSGIVRGSQGHIEVDSTLDVGTTFRVYLPRVEREALENREESPPDEELPGLDGRTLLVAEDEDAVLRFVERALLHAGARVICARDGNAALELIREHLDDLDGLILDLTMPGRGGVEVLREAWKLRPDLPTLISSGFDLSDSLGALADDPRVSILHKPYRMTGLLSAVELLFERGSAPEAAQTR